MQRIRLIHWKAEEAAEGARRLRAFGFEVGDVGLAADLVDYRICSIDNVWSAPLFTRRGPKG